MSLRTLLCALCGTVLLYGCAEEQQPETVETIQTVKTNAIEMVAQTKRLPDGRLVMHLHRNFYNKAALIKQDTMMDTLPSLGTEQVVDEGSTELKTVPVEYNVLFKVDTLRY
jgi:PBP1b-binding outer membrane lipoprotein LpoB